MPTVAELMKQRLALETQIETARKAEIADAVARVKALVAENGLTAKDIFGPTTRPRKSGASGTVAPKYRDPATGTTWTGRGRTPKWIEGKDRSIFVI